MDFTISDLSCLATILVPLLSFITLNRAINSRRRRIISDELKHMASLKSQERIDKDKNRAAIKIAELEYKKEQLIAQQLSRVS